MKKLLISTSTFLVAIIAIIISLACIKPNLNFTYGTPTKITAYKSGSSTGSNSSNGHSSDTITYRELNEKIQEMFKVSMLTEVANGTTTKPVVGQDLGGKYATFSSTILTTNYALRLDYDSDQKQVVVYDGSTKTITYRTLYLIIDPAGDYQEVRIYFATSSTTNTSSFNSSPMTAYANTDSIIKYIDSVFTKFDS